METDEHYMRIALEEAKRAGESEEAPIGAVLVGEDGAVIAAAGNAPIATDDPTGHAEIRALRAAGKVMGNYRLNNTTLYVTLEPCVMCAGAISHARVKRLVIAASDPKGGGVWHGPKFFEQSTCHWRPTVAQGPFAEEASMMLKTFFPCAALTKAAIRC